mmetsp:Transcript_38551/g.93401  ORF Transcript_38551/g.93401 Transcript_38551/m.93401 type:complete len:547 (+) Transcript_38551:45-1685(+)
MPLSPFHRHIRLHRRRQNKNRKISTGVATKTTTLQPDCAILRSKLNFWRRLSTSSRRSNRKSSLLCLWSLSVFSCLHDGRHNFHSTCSAFATKQPLYSTARSLATISATSDSTRMESSHSSSLPPTLDTDHCRGIYFGSYHQPVHEKIESQLHKNSHSIKCKKNHVWVKVYAVSLNPVDAKGVIGDKLPSTFTKLRTIVHNCMVKNTRVGFDFAGVVVTDPSRVGSGNDDADTRMKKKNDNSNIQQASSSQNEEQYPPGTRVFGTMPPLKGSFATFVEVPTHQIAVAPSKLSMTECAALPLVGLTALQALKPWIINTDNKHRNDDDNLQHLPSSNVLIVGGSGGTGHVAIQVARALGAQNVVTICGTSNVQFCHEVGATYVVDYKTTSDIVGQLKDIVSSPDKLNGQRFDVILDCVTSGDPNDRSFDYPGRIRDESADIVTHDHLYQRLGGRFGDWVRAGIARPGIIPHSMIWPDPRERLFWIKFPYSSQFLSELAQMSDEGKLKPRLEKLYNEMTADTVQQAMEDVLSQRVQGKVVIRAVPEIIE